MILSARDAATLLQLEYATFTSRVRKGVYRDAEVEKVFGRFYGFDREKLLKIKFVPDYKPQKGRDPVHGMSHTPTYRSWRAMRSRCEDPSRVNYPKYGGRGVRVCDRWKIFANFFEDMGVRPVGTTLDRYPNNDGNYEPGNCRWATPHEQRINQRPRKCS